MRRLLLVALVGAGCSDTSLAIDVTLATDVPPLTSIFVRMFGTREIGDGRSLTLPAGARSGQIVINDIDPAITDFRVLLSGRLADQTAAAQGTVRVRPDPGHRIAANALLISGALPDADGDGVPDAIDDCPEVADPKQDQSCTSMNDLAVSQNDLGKPYFVGGSVTGLVGSLVLRNNGGDDLVVANNGSFTFVTGLHTGNSYAVTVQTQPQNQLCTVMNGTGVIGLADVTDVAVTCVSGHTVGGTLSGLMSGAVLLRNNGVDPLPLSGNGSFTFSMPVAEGAPYAVTVPSPAPAHTCVVASGSGIMGTTAVTNVAVTCMPPTVVINEVYARPASAALGDTNGDGLRDSGDDEFVELINRGTDPQDLSGWTLRTGATTLTLRFTFPGGTTLPAGGRAVVFGGGTPTGSFGTALTFVGGGLALSDAPATFTIRLESGGVAVDTFTYDGTTFGSSCTNACASQVRNPEGTGGFVAHTTASGSAGVLWSPGVAATAAIPKANRVLSVPAAGAMNVSVLTPIAPQFNMLMTSGDFDNAHLKLFASTCAAMMNEVTGFTSIGAGPDATSAKLIPNGPLAFATTYCMSIGATTRSAINEPLGTAATWELTTRAAASAPAATIVLSEVGGCRLSSTSGTTACGGTGANDEFVELYNPTLATVDISGWFLQRRTAGGSTSCLATVPPGTMIAAGHYYLIGGVGYTPARYANTPAADLAAAGSLLLGGSESMVLISSSGTCTGSTGVIDAVSFGTITDTLATLQLPPASAGVIDGSSVERKACFDSTSDTTLTGLLVGGGHELKGNSERIGAGNADWVVRPSPNPQNLATAAESKNCP